MNREPSELLKPGTGPASRATASNHSLAAVLPPEQRAAFMDHVPRSAMCSAASRGIASGDFRADQQPQDAAEMILARLETQRLPLAHGGDLSAAVHRILPFTTLGISGIGQWR